MCGLTDVLGGILPGAAKKSASSAASVNVASASTATEFKPPTGTPDIRPNALGSDRTGSGQLGLPVNQDNIRRVVLGV